MRTEMLRVSSDQAAEGGLRLIQPAPSTIQRGQVKEIVCVAWLKRRGRGEGSNCPVMIAKGACYDRQVAMGPRIARIELYRP